jgi:hypothetical protein
LLDEGRQHERGARLLVRQTLMQVVHDVAEDVHAGQIERAEGGAVRTPDRRTGHRVDLFDGVLAGRDPCQHRGDAVQRQMIADEVRRVLRDHHPFTETAVGERRDGVDDGRPGLCSRNDLEEAQVARRVEEMRPEPVLPEVFAAPLGEHGDWNP